MKAASNYIGEFCTLSETHEHTDGNMLNLSDIS